MSEPQKNVLTISQGYQAVYDFTGKASEINRSLALAGIAVIWVFKTGDGSSQKVPGELVPPAFALVVALGLDLLQYVVAATVWYFFTRSKETGGVETFSAPSGINLPATIFFMLKIVATIVAYVYLLVFLLPKIAG
jgi:hypothetical protein